jgi:hypothetical protein
MYGSYLTSLIALHSPKGPLKHRTTPLPMVNPGLSAHQAMANGTIHTLLVTGLVGLDEPVDPQVAYAPLEPHLAFRGVLGNKLTRTALKKPQSSKPR